MEPLLNNVTEVEHQGMRFFASRMATHDIVSIEGSVYGGSYQLVPSKRTVSRLAAGLLDADTKHHSKDSRREALASRGASLSFSDSADRVTFQASCFPEDVAFVCKTIAESLSEAAFLSKELSAERSRAIAEIEEAKTETNVQASYAFSRQLFDPGHINYTDTLDGEARQIANASRSDLTSFAKLLGKGGLVLAITGDIVPDKALADAQRAFSALSEGTAILPSLPANKNAAHATETLVHIPDKANIDFFIGAPVSLTYHDRRYLPFMTLSSMLGGGGIFLGHLMRTIRERDGYTYGIYARPYGFEAGADGAFRVWATFSPKNYDKAVAATRKEIATFFSSGITPDALLMQQDNTIGSYAVNLATSRGVASMLHKIGKEGKPLSYLNEFPALIRSITLDDLQEAAALIPLSELSVAAAGTFPKK